MKLWFTRDEDGDWGLYYDQPWLEERVRFAGREDEARTKVWRTQPSGLACSSDAEALARLLGIGLEAREKLLVDVRARPLAAQPGVVLDRHDARWAGHDE